MKSEKIIQDVAFVNRKIELKFLRNFLEKKPSEILFLHGPKSSGKTTLLYRLFDELKKGQKINVRFFNLRKIYLGNYQDFLKAFFHLDYSKSKDDVKEIREYDIKLFKLTVESLKGLEDKKLDPFVVMETELQKDAENGIKPVIIIDELQALQEIYINGQRSLITELFNFFVAMTKESHLAYIIISSSDGYFIDEVYNESKLKKTSQFYEIDYLLKEDVWEWLTNLEKYSKIRDYTLTEEEIEMLWDTVGGSMWEIQLLLFERFHKDIKTICKTYLNQMKSLIDDYIKFSDSKKQILKKFSNKIFNTNNDFSDIKGPELEPLLKDMVHNNILYYNPVKAVYYPQGRSLELGIKMYFETAES